MASYSTKDCECAEDTVFGQCINSFVACVSMEIDRTTNNAVWEAVYYHIISIVYVLQILCCHTSMAWTKFDFMFPTSKQMQAHIFRAYFNDSFMYVHVFISFLSELQEICSCRHIWAPDWNACEQIKVPETIREDPGGIPEHQGLLICWRYVA